MYICEACVHYCEIHSHLPRIPKQIFVAGFIPRPRKPGAKDSITCSTEACVGPTVDLENP